jgi:hypothetical protein
MRWQRDTDFVAQRTQLLNNQIRVGGSPLWWVGNVTARLSKGGYYGSTNRGVSGITIPISDGFPATFKVCRVAYQNVEMSSGPLDESCCAIEPLLVESITVENCDLRLLGNSRSKPIDLSVHTYFQLLQNA